MLVLLFHALPLRIKQWVCGYLAPGHHYTVEMIRLEDSPMYVVDPFTHCSHCDLLLPTRIYDRLVAEIEFDPEEDEVF